MEVVLVGACIFYLSALLWYLTGFKKLDTEFKTNKFPPPSVSVIIAARNEESNILTCLNSLLVPENKKLITEIIVVDDFSTDQTFKLITELSIQNPIIIPIQTQNFPLYSGIKSPKKRAIQCALSVAKGDWIAFTDADCLVPRTWVSVFTQAVSNSSQLIAGPVEFFRKGTFLSSWQHLEFAGLMVVAGGSIGHNQPSTINGANLWIRKSAFSAVEGFAGIDHLISGDDELLMHKIHSMFKDGIQYLPTREALVLTHAQPDWTSLFNQRKRWASKGFHYQSGRYKVFLTLFWFIHVLFLVMPVFAFFNLVSWAFLGFILLLKFAGDAFFLSASNSFLHQKINPFSVLWFGWIQIPYLVFTGFMGTFSRFDWKGVRY